MNPDTIKDIQECQHVFVYGTLKQAHGNHRLIKANEIHFASDAVTVEEFHLYVDGLPFVVEKEEEGGKRIEGELYVLEHSEQLAALDRLEGHPNFYERRVIEVETESGAIVDAWLYFHPDTSRFDHIPNFTSFEEGIQAMRAAALPV